MQSGSSKQLHYLQKSFPIVVLDCDFKNSPTDAALDGRIKIRSIKSLYEDAVLLHSQSKHPGFLLVYSFCASYCGWWG